MLLLRGITNYLSLRIGQMNKPLMIALMGLALPVQAEVYKCMDANGRSVYQEMPCETSKLQQVGTVKKPATSSVDERGRMSALEEKNKARFAANQESRKKEEMEEQRRRDVAYMREIAEKLAAAEENTADE